MDTDLGTVLAIAGISLLILILVLTALAFLVSGMTSLLKGMGDEKEENNEQEEETTVTMATDDGLKEKAAAIGVALARAELELSPVSMRDQKGEYVPWREFHHARRLNQSIRMRRN